MSSLFQVVKMSSRTPCPYPCPFVTVPLPVPVTVPVPVPVPVPVAGLTAGAERLIRSISLAWSSTE